MLLNGTLSQSETAAFQRIEKTFLGLSMYLLIDNLVLPRRTDASIRDDVLRATDDSVSMLEGCIDSVSALLVGEGTEPDFATRLTQSSKLNETTARSIAR